MNRLIVIPCSARKRRGGIPGAEGPRIVDLIPSSLGAQLSATRDAVAGRANVDERQLMPARQRYSGAFYEACGGALDGRAHDTSIVILSGGYGALLADEPIGYYDRVFARSDWPRSVIPSVLVEVAASIEARHVIGFLARSTQYAAVMRATKWPASVETARLIAPAWKGGGAQAGVPRIAGLSLRAYLADVELDESWRSGDVGLSIEDLR